MAVIPGSVCLHWNGSTGSAEPSGARYVAVWRLKTDDPLDQSKTVVEWWQINMFPLYTPYVYGNDTASLTALALNISADRLKETLDSWEVTVNYGPPDQQDQEQRDDEGNFTEDPLLWRKRFVCGTTQGRRMVQFAKYIGGYGATFETRYPPAGAARIMPSNSAFTPFVNPPVEEDTSRAWLMVGGNFAPTVDVHAATSIENTVNQEVVVINHRGMTYTAAAQTLKIRQVKIEPRTNNNVDYVAIDYYFDVAPLIERRGPSIHDTWDSLTLDSGVYSRRLVGDPDGAGGQVGQGDYAAESPKLGAHTDKDGEIITDVVPFDGDGKPLDFEGVAAAPAEVFGRWQHYRVIDFHAQQYLSTLIETLGP